MRALGLLAVGALALGCMGKPPTEEDSAGLAIAARNVRVMGSIAYGDEVTGTTQSGRKYRAWQFEGAAGDVVDVRASSRLGDTVAYICDASFNILAKNDDAEEGAVYPTDSHATATLPTAGSYFVAVKDYNGERRRFTVTLDAVGGADEAWQQAARAEATRLAGEYSPLEELRVALHVLPAAGRERAAAMTDGGLEVPLTCRLHVEGRVLYVVFATDGSGEGGTVAIDLIDGDGRWFAHGVAHSFWEDEPAFQWSIEEHDRTVCRCDAGGDFATCVSANGETAPSRLLRCDPEGWEASARELIEAELRDGFDVDDPRRVDPATLGGQAAWRMEAMRAAPDMEYARAYRFEHLGGDLLVILGNQDAHFWVDLIEPMDDWFAHGTGQFADGAGGLGWTLDDGDRTICTCDRRNEETEMAGCIWTDETVTFSENIECD